MSQTPALRHPLLCTPPSPLKPQTLTTGSPKDVLPRPQPLSCPQVLETVERLGEAVRTELTTLEEVLEPRTELVAAARGARRQAEAVAQQLQGLAFWQGVPLSPLQVAEDVSFAEEYR